MTSTHAKILLELLETYWIDACDAAEDFGLEVGDLHELKGYLTGFSMDVDWKIAVNRCICNEIGNELCPLHFPEQSNLIFDGASKPNQLIIKSHDE